MTEELNIHGDPICGACGRGIGYFYEQQNDCCSEAPVEETPLEEEDATKVEEEEAEEEVVEEEESLDNEDLEAYLEELPVKELKKLCKEADLSGKGKKADLVARLLE